MPRCPITNEQFATESEAKVYSDRIKDLLQEDSFHPFHTEEQYARAYLNLSDEIKHSWRVAMKTTKGK